MASCLKIQVIYSERRWLTVLPKSCEIHLSLSVLQIWKTLGAKTRLKTKSLGTWLRPPVHSGTKLSVCATRTPPPGPPLSRADPSKLDLHITCEMTAATSRHSGHWLKCHHFTSYGQSTEFKPAEQQHIILHLIQIQFYSALPVWLGLGLPSL